MRCQGWLKQTPSDFRNILSRIWENSDVILDGGHFMCCHIRSASASRRRQVKLRKAPTLAMLDLSKPGEREAHEFLLRTIDPKDKMWTILDVRRLGDVLLCVVQWVCPAKKTKPYALAEVSLTESAVRWRDYPEVEVARSELRQRCAEQTVPDGDALV